MRWTWWWRPPCLLRVVIVNLKDDPATAIKGVLWRARGAWLVLVNAELLKAASAPTPVDGDVVVHRSNVAFLQVIP